jgi:hypothetical protein
MSDHETRQKIQNLHKFVGQVRGFLVMVRRPNVVDHRDRTSTSAL